MVTRFRNRNAQLAEIGNRVRDDALLTRSKNVRGDAAALAKSCCVGEFDGDFLSRTVGQSEFGGVVRPA